METRDELIGVIVKAMTSLNEMLEAGHIEDLPVLAQSENDLAAVTNLRLDHEGWIIFKTEYLCKGGYEVDS